MVFLIFLLLRLTNYKNGAIIDENRGALPAREPKCDTPNHTKL